MRLIDVKLKCLVEKSSDEIQQQKTSWVALSYVWGTRKIAFLTKETKQAFEKEGYFTPATVPRSIYDVIEVTHGLRERYLWADYLCIIQDLEG